MRPLEDGDVQGRVVMPMEDGEDQEKMGIILPPVTGIKENIAYLHLKPILLDT